MNARQTLRQIMAAASLGAIVLLTPAVAQSAYALPVDPSTIVPPGVDPASMSSPGVDPTSLLPAAGPRLASPPMAWAWASQVAQTSASAHRRRAPA